MKIEVFRSYYTVNTLVVPINEKDVFIVDPATEIPLEKKNPVAIDLLSQNSEKFEVDNIVAINAEAPEGLRNVSRIDVAIVGGSGGKIAEILDTIDAKLKVGGRIVLNFITVQSLNACLVWLKKHLDYKYETIQVQISRLEIVGGYDMYKAMYHKYYHLHL